jgi:hypothetical protein
MLPMSGMARSQILMIAILAQTQIRLTNFVALFAGHCQALSVEVGEKRNGFLATYTSRYRLSLQMPLANVFSLRVDACTLAGITTTDINC